MLPTYCSVSSENLPIVGFVKNDDASRRRSILSIHYPLPNTDTNKTLKLYSWIYFHKNLLSPRIAASLMLNGA